MVQHTVVGVDGVTVPMGAPPDGAQEPPVAALPVAIAALSPAPEQAAGADSIITPPLQFASPEVETAAMHWMPVGAPHVQALQALESTIDA